MAKKEDSLGPYRGKRDFERTPEPAGGRKRRGRTQPRFVVHKHDATTLHYDFRLEAAGVLKSWAVPKGPSTNPKDKRLAMPTQDHPLAYFDYEGLIPDGRYGAGPVIVWDTGSYRSLTELVDRAVTDGHVAVWLEGRKLRGGYALTRIGRGKRERWRWSRWPTRRPTPGASQSRANRSRWSRVEPSRRSPRRARPARIGGVGSAGGREPSWPARCRPLSATGGSPIRDGSYTTPPGRHPRACVGAAFSAHVALERASARGTGHLSTTPQEVGPVMRCPSGVPAPRTGSDVVLTS